MRFRMRLGRVASDVTFGVRHLTVPDAYGSFSRPKS